MHSVSALGHDAHSSATDTPGMYMLESVNVWLQYRLGEERCLVGKLLSIFKRVYFHFSTFHEGLKNRRHRSQIISRRRNGYKMNSGLSKGLLTRKHLGETGAQNCTGRILLKSYEESQDFTFRGFYIGLRADCHPINSKQFENLDSISVQRVVC